MALIYFAVTLFVSAFLLFLVQPMIGKMILPQLGGTPQVWNTCMMFFQIALLAGYAYTHTVTSKLSVKAQLLTHCIMLLLPLPVLLAFGRPFYVGDFGAEGGGNPVFLTLALLTMIVGIPFLVVSTTAPLLQRWFNHTGHPASHDPYFLYGASNAGSILGLLLYPVGVELFLTLDQQAYFWLFGYLALAVLVAGCAFMVLKSPTIDQPTGGTAPEPEPPPPELPVAPVETSTAVTATPPAPAVARSTGIRRGGKQRGRGGRGPVLAASGKSAGINIKKASEPVEEEEEEKIYEVTPLRRLRWIGLAAVPTSLMLGCTTYISTDISPVPLLWIIPLTLYLLSFVLVFLRWPVPWVGVGRNPRNMTPHKVMVVMQLMLIAFLMIIIMMGAYSPPWRAMAVSWAAFFLTALVCHGELARDRPPTKYLTEFYLWMSVGGMIGGTFNALIAPLVPWFGLFEFPLALVFAGLVRPGGKGRNWTDFLFDGMPKEQADGLKYLLDIVLAVVLLAFFWVLVKQATDRDGFLGWRMLRDPVRVENATKFNETYNPMFRVFYKTLGMNPNTSYNVTYFLSILLVYGLPIGIALACWKRPTRLALCLGAIFLAHAFYETGADERTLRRDRSYFGILRVLDDEERRIVPGQKGGQDTSVLIGRYTYLMHGTTHHGLNFIYPDGSSELPDLTRIATTYYHRDCPVGIVMEQLNWFPGYKSDSKEKDADKRLSYWADARLPASIIGSGVPGLGVNLPIAQIVSAWSEPPYATIGLGTGTMASYGRPYQHVTFFEIDEHILDFSLPPQGRDMYFTYLQGALKRGCKLEVIMGDARFTMSKERLNENGTYYLDDYTKAKDRKAQVAWKNFTSFPMHQNYYRVIEVDAFSSDAIPVHLITKQAIELYMNKLLPNGVLCVHTSNRHVNLVQPVLKICEEAQWEDWTNMIEVDDPANPGKKIWRPKIETGLKWVICKDSGEEDSRSVNLGEPSRSGHFSSEYVMVARKQEYLPPYTLTKEQMESYKAQGILAMTYNFHEDKLYTEAGLKVFPKRGDSLHSSSVDFYLPSSYNDPKVNFTQRNGRTVMDNYGYVLPANTWTWTDNYSNIWSVFRW